jgi:uncharacterized membrane-anchored protein/uncharacterized membrane protein
MTYKIRLLRTGYVLGISLILAAIIYFFAANWGGLERLQKIWLSGGLVALFYGASFLPALWPKLAAHRDFLSRLLLLGGLITFGVAVALIGQTYNSHADSFGLFLIWTVPALLLSIVTRHSWFYLSAYVLGHVTLWFYFFPSAVNYSHSDAKQALIFGVFAAINLALFALCQRKVLQSQPIRYVSFIIFHVAVLWLSNSFIINEIGYIGNVVTVAAILVSFYYFSKINLDKWALSVTGLAASAYLVLKYFELSEAYYSEFFFITGILFVALLLTGNVFFFRYITQLHGEDADETFDIPADAQAEQSALDPALQSQERELKKKQREAGHLAAKIVSTVVTIVGIFIGSFSLIAFIFLASFLVEPEYVLLVISLLFTIPMIFIPKINNVIRYTVLTIGYIAGIVAILWMDEPGLSMTFLILAAAGWVRLSGLYQRLFTYFIFNLVMGIALFQTHTTSGSDQFTYDLLFLLAVNAVVYGLSFLIQNARYRNHLRGSGLYFGLILLFWLTFMPSIFAYSHLILNVGYFVLTTWLVVHFIQRERHADSTLSLVFWFAFVAFQYYDLVWKLLHKSFTLLALGIIVFVVMLYLEGRMKRNHGELDLDASSGRGLPYTRLAAILLIIVLQFGFIGYQTISNEQLLKNGTSIKLELQPVDPRSLLQGDYVQLSYTISTPDEGKFAIEELASQKRVKVVLYQAENGLHVFDRMYREGETLQAGEVMITGRTDGWRFIYYGIESYFVPEGTGLEVERNAKFALVRVGKSGNALLEKLLSE